MLNCVLVSLSQQAWSKQQEYSPTDLQSITRILVICWWKKRLITLISNFIWREKSPWILQRSRASGLNLISIKEIQFRQRWSTIQAFPHARHPFFLLVFWWLFTARTWCHNEGSAGIASLRSSWDLLSISSFALKCSKRLHSFLEVCFFGVSHIVSIVFLLCFMFIHFNRSWTCFRLDKQRDDFDWLLSTGSQSWWLRKVFFWSILWYNPGWRM